MELSLDEVTAIVGALYLENAALRKVIKEYQNESKKENENGKTE